MNILKKNLAPAFVILELVMHIYLSVYLTFHWTNWTIWLFTAFETAGFVYLLALGKPHNHARKESLAEKHMRHYQFCGCLGDMSVCCNLSCPCHWDDQ